jgi:hypothetical protein
MLYLVWAWPAHFDGQHICLDERFSLTLNAKLTVTLLPDPEESQDECEAWLRLSEQKLERVYGDDEPDYSGFLKEENPDYAGR